MLFEDRPELLEDLEIVNGLFEAVERCKLDTKVRFVLREVRDHRLDLLAMLNDVVEFLNVEFETLGTVGVLHEVVSVFDILIDQLVDVVSGLRNLFVQDNASGRLQNAYAGLLVHQQELLLHFDVVIRLCVLQVVVLLLLLAEGVGKVWLVEHRDRILLSKLLADIGESDEARLLLIKVLKEHVLIVELEFLHDGVVAL